MKIRDSLTGKNLIAGSAVLSALLVVGGFFVLRRPARVAMARHSPADALAFVEIDSFADLVEGFTSTRAWNELAPLLGLSSQLKQVGLVADLMGRTGLGPDEAVASGRAQCAVAITGIESDAGETAEGPYIHLKPDFVVLVETHMTHATAARLARERAPFIAERIFGDSVEEETVDHSGAGLSIFRGPELGRQLVVSSLGSVVLIGNQASAVKSCLDVIAGRAASLADEPALELTRAEVDVNAPVFAYLTARGIQKVAELWPLVIAGRTADTDIIRSFSDLLEHLSNQAVSGVFYSLQFEADGVTEKYLMAFQPQVAQALKESVKPASAASFESLALIPQTIESLTLLKVERAGELPERILKHLSPNFDVVAGVALRELVINFRKEYGIEPSDSVGDDVGAEIALVSFGDDQPRAMLLRVMDRSRLSQAVEKYLARKGAPAVSGQHDGIEVRLSSSDNRRAAAFVGDFLVLGTPRQVGAVIDTNEKHDGIDGDQRFTRALSARPVSAPIVSYRTRDDDAGKLILALSKLTRVSDGGHELLERDSARKALDRLPHATSFTEFREKGILVQTHSAVGNFGYIASLIGAE